MGVPGWLLHLVVAFLEHKCMKVKYRGKFSRIFSLPGGGPQGTLLGLFLFLVLVNDSGFMGQSNNAGELITARKKIKELNTIHLKFVDDLTIAESVDMSTQLKFVPRDQRPQPDKFRDRTGYQLKTEESKVFLELKNIEMFTKTNKMKLNIEKSKVMLFNPCRTLDFEPKIELSNKELNMVEKTKLLGIMVSSDLSWEDNTNYIVERCNKRIWILRRLKKLGARINDLVDVYCKQIRSIAEYGVPIWNSSLTGNQIVKLERIQKTAFHVILGSAYTSYSSALKILNMKKICVRRVKLCLKFALKCEKHLKFKNWFVPT